MRPHAVTFASGQTHTYDNNGNLTSRAGKALTWHADNTVASVVGPNSVPEGYSYDASGQRATRSRNLGQAGGFTTAYLGGLYEEDAPSGEKRLLYRVAGRVVAQRTIPALRADHRINAAAAGRSRRRSAIRRCRSAR